MADKENTDRAPMPGKAEEQLERLVIIEAGLHRYCRDNLEGACTTCATVLALARQVREAEQELQRLREGLKALADDIWRESQGDHTIIRDAGIMQDIVPRIRALLGGEQA